MITRHVITFPFIAKCFPCRHSTKQIAEQVRWFCWAPLPLSPSVSPLPSPLRPVSFTLCVSVLGGRGYMSNIQSLSVLHDGGHAQEALGTDIDRYGVSTYEVALIRSYPGCPQPSSRQPCPSTKARTQCLPAIWIGRIFTVILPLFSRNGLIVK